MKRMFWPRDYSLTSWQGVPMSVGRDRGIAYSSINGEPRSLSWAHEWRFSTLKMGSVMSIWNGLCHSLFPGTRRT